MIRSPSCAIIASISSACSRGTFPGEPTLMTIPPRLLGWYATRILLSLSGLARGWRRSARRWRGKTEGGLQPVTLPAISWRRCTRRRLAGVREPAKANGNIRLSELAVINLLAADCADGTDLFEIGTFDGRTTLNLALSAPPRCRVFSLDLPHETRTRFELAAGEDHMVDKGASGQRIEAYRQSHARAVARIYQLYGDSARFDFGPYRRSCSLVFVDGSHHYDYVMSDSYRALEMVRPGGVILWHDYGIWEGVTRALEDLERREKLRLKSIRGTSLVYWRYQA